MDAFKLLKVLIQYSHLVVILNFIVVNHSVSILVCFWGAQLQLIDVVYFGCAGHTR